MLEELSKLCKSDLRFHTRTLLFDEVSMSWAVGLGLGVGALDPSWSNSRIIDLSSSWLLELVISLEACVTGISYPFQTLLMRSSWKQNGFMVIANWAAFGCSYVNSMGNIPILFHARLYDKIASTGNGVVVKLWYHCYVMDEKEVETKILLEIWSAGWTQAYEITKWVCLHVVCHWFWSDLVCLPAACSHGKVCVLHALQIHWQPFCLSTFFELHFLKAYSKWPVSSNWDAIFPIASMLLVQPKNKWDTQFAIFSSRIPIM